VVSGEEFGEVSAGEYRWILDPIDGTKNYVRGVPVWATLIALEIRGALSVAVVSAPALGQRWHATREGGAFAADGRRMRVSAVSTFADAQVFTAGDKDLRTMVPGYDAFVEKVWRTRGFGDFWQHILVADGAADVAIDPVLSEYDIAAPMLIVEEAGGRVTTLAGAHDMAGGSAVSTNGVLHDAVIAALAATPKTD
jgi:histidinol-phosphatase